MTSQSAYTPEHENTYAAEYLKGIDLFNAGDYYECHEVLEDVWVIATGREKLYYQGLIMAAVALYDYDVGRFGAARTMHRKATDRLGQLPIRFMSLDIPDFIHQLDQFFDFTVEEARSGRHNLPGRPVIRLVV